MQSTRKIRIAALPSVRLAPVSALPRPYAVEFKSDWAELLAEVPRLPPSAIVLLDCTPEGRSERVPARVWELLLQFPSVAIVAALDVPSVAPDLVGQLLSRGVADVLDLSLEDTPALAERRLREAHARPFKRSVEDGLDRYPSARARMIIRAAAHVAATGGAAAELAAQFNVTPETVLEWCAAAALPPPRRLQAWMRVLLAAFLLKEPSRTISGVAVACGYTADRALRRAFNRFLGVDARTLRGRGAFQMAMREFNRELSNCREPRNVTQERGS
jgi:AraC-like DNA-binding protein